MKILAVGDCHGYDNIKDIKVNDDIDLILLTGDLADATNLRKYYFEGEKKKLNDWRENLSRKELTLVFTQLINSGLEVLKYFNQFNIPVYFVYGNVFGMEFSLVKKTVEMFKIRVPDFENIIQDMKNIQNIDFKIINFNNFNIMGIPYFNSVDWTKRFDSKNINKTAVAKIQEVKVRKFLKENNHKNIDLILSHIPAFGILDKVGGEFAPENWKGKNAGDKMLLDFIKNNKFKYFICGHIHEASGEEEFNDGKIYNLGMAKTKIIEL